MLYDPVTVSYVNHLGQRISQLSAQPKRAPTFRVVAVAELRRTNAHLGALPPPQGPRPIASAGAMVGALRSAPEPSPAAPFGKGRPVAVCP